MDVNRSRLAAMDHNELQVYLLTQSNHTSDDTSLVNVFFFKKVFSGLFSLWTP